MSGEFFISIVIAICGGSLAGRGFAKKDWVTVGFAAVIVVANICSSIF